MCLGEFSSRDTATLNLSRLYLNPLYFAVSARSECSELILGWPCCPYTFLASDTTEQICIKFSI